MITEKKYVTTEYIGSLCIGMLRYKAVDSNNKSLICIGNFLNYFFVNKHNPYSQLSKVYEAENLVYLKILGALVTFKITNPSMEHGELKQELINQIENAVDNNSFSKGHKFINHMIESVDSDRFNNSVINKEYEKCLKYILLNDSINNLSVLFKDYFTKDNASEEYDKALSTIFHNYEEGIINDDFVIDDDDADVSNALDECVDVHEEVREISFLSDIRFIEKKRIAILIGASGAGKSMFLCHSAAEYLQAPKSPTQKHLIFYFTFENSKAETFLRIIANITDITIDQLKEDILDPVKKKIVMNKFRAKKDKNTVLIISELPPKRHNMTTLEAIIDKNLLKFKDSEVYGVLLDYVDKMKPIANNKTLRTDEIVGLIVDDFKALSKKYDTCGITVSQFNREGAKKARSDDEMATGTDIGGGWSKYENADIVITMQVKNQYEELGYNIVVLVNEKHRYHRDGTTVNCIYKPQYAKFQVSDAMSGGAMEGRFSSDDSTSSRKKENDIFDKVSVF